MTEDLASAFLSPCHPLTPSPPHLVTLSYFSAVRVTNFNGSLQANFSYDAPGGMTMKSGGATSSHPVHASGTFHIGDPHRSPAWIRRHADYRQRRSGATQGSR